MILSKDWGAGCGSASLPGSVDDVKNGSPQHRPAIEGLVMVVAASGLEADLRF